MKNEEFVKKFEQNLSFSYYGNELRRHFDEAILVRDKSLVVESSLNFTFGNFFPKLVLNKLAENLTVEDLPAM